MAGWFAKLMHQGLHVARSSPGENGDVGARDARYDAILQALRDREVEHRNAREKRQRWYKQPLTTEADAERTGSNPSSPVRLHKIRTKVPCRATPEAQALLDDLKKRFAGGTVSFQHGMGRQNAVLLTRRDGAEPKQVGWVEQCVETDPKHCHVSHQGLTVETDDGMLVFRFRYPATPVSVTGRRIAEGRTVDFAEIRPALELRPGDKDSPPRLVWVTRPEIDTLNALRSRDYEAFYVRFKLEVMAGIWHSLSGVLANLPASRWHRGAHYSLVREPDAPNRRIFQRTVDDNGRATDIGSDRIYDAASATDLLLLYLEEDILADLADIYFTIQSLGSVAAYSLKEEFFTIIRRFWGSAPSLVSCYGSDLEAVVRMSQRAAPMPAQTPLLQQDWTNLRQALVDRYGSGGRKASALGGIHRPRIGAVAWPFTSYPAGDVNVGLRVIYRQEWKNVGVAEPTDPTESVDTVVERVSKATRDAMKWPADCDGSINTGARALAARTDMGLEAECRESTRETCARLCDLTMRSAVEARGEDAEPLDGKAVTTRPAELQNVVMIAEKLPAPAEIDLAWVRRHDWILSKVLLDDSFRVALDAVGQDAETLGAERERLYAHLRAHVLHYQRAIWDREEPQQRSMRYRKLGKKVPMEWRFELESGSQTIDELADRLAAPSIDGQFAAYSEGRQADLDQIIDPSGPVGYYCNYAIYRMRPEFGSAELFSMLHFFKSPYLRPNPFTGEPHVEDPTQVAAPRDEPESVPVVPPDESPAPEAPEQSVAELKEEERAEESGLLLENMGDISLMVASGRREPEGEVEVPLLRTKNGASPLLAGGGGKESPQSAADSAGVSPPGNEAAARVVRAGPAQDREVAQPIVVRDDGRPHLSVIAGAPMPREMDQAIQARGAGTKRLAPMAGAAVRHAPERVIVARIEGLSKAVGAGGVRALGQERPIDARGAPVVRPSPVAEESLESRLNTC